MSIMVKFEWFVKSEETKTFDEAELNNCLHCHYFPVTWKRVDMLDFIESSLGYGDYVNSEIRYTHA